MANGWGHLSQAYRLSDARHAAADRFGRLLSQIGDCAWMFDLAAGDRWISTPVWSLLNFRSESDYHATNPTEADGESIGLAARLHPDETDHLLRAAQQLLAKPGTLDESHRLRMADGEYRWFRTRATSEAGPSGRVTRVSGVTRDVHAQTLAAVRESTRARALLMMAKGAALPEVLTAIVRGVEAEHPSMLCSILLLDDSGTRLTMGAAPSLPADYNALVEGVQIGPDVGCCGTAAFTRMRIISPDLASDPKWDAFLPAANAAGLAACWSEPILGSAGQVLGTFAIYHRQPHAPTAADLELISTTARLASVAIERQRTDGSLRWWTAFFESLANASVDGVLVVDNTGHTIFQNQRMIELWNMPPEIAYTREDRVQVEYVLSQLKDPQAFVKRVEYLYAHPAESCQCEIEKLDGSTLERFSAPVQGADGTYYGRIWTFRDVTERKALELKLIADARTDRLTGLPNRFSLVEQIEAAIARRRTAPNAEYGLLFLDFDRFKLVNDTLGHAAGDRLLQAISGRLVSTLASAELQPYLGRTNVVGRLAGDEFIVLIDELPEHHDLRAIADRLGQALNTPYQLGSHEVNSTASIGVVISQPNHTTPSEVLRDADMAMYEAKSAGRGRVAMFDQAMRRRIERRIALEQGIRPGIDAGEFIVHYQPIVSLQTGRVASFEALVRWQHPTFGVVSPGEFIPLAEENGLITDLGYFVFETACRQLAAWWRELGRDAIPSISINLSRVQLSLPDLPHRLLTVANQAGVVPSAIHLEVTESAIMSDARQAIEVLNRLKEFGFHVDMDDFGTGYSSLSSLHQFPIDVLKIDRSFVENLSRGRAFVALVSAICTLAQNLGIQVIAEGVETHDQLVMLQALDCQYAQGYAFAPAIPADAVPDYLLGQDESLSRLAAA